MENYLDKQGLQYYTRRITDKFKTMFSLKGDVGQGALSAQSVSEMTDNTKIYVYTGHETGYTFGDWYYWDIGTSKWVSGGAYNAVVVETDKTLTIENMAADAKVVGDELEKYNSYSKVVGDELEKYNSYFNVSPTNVLDINKDNIFNGYYTTNGTLITNNPDYFHTFIECNPNDVFYANITGRLLTISFFDSEKIFLGFLRYNTGEKIVVPNNVQIKYMSIPLLRGRMGTYIVSKTPIASSFVIYSDTGVNGYSDTELKNKIKTTNLSNGEITIENYKSNTIINRISTTPNSKWECAEFNITNVTTTGFSNNNLLLARNENEIIFYSFGNGNIVKATLGTSPGKYTLLGNFPIINNAAIAACRINIDYNNIITLTNITENIKVEIPIYQYAPHNFHACFGMVWANVPATANRNYATYIDSNCITHEPISISTNQWNNKIWYAYGTSITNINNEGKYPNYLKSFSGMILVNKGISGGGIGDFGGYSHGQVYDAICNITDGKLEADLITLETGANDTGANVPLGTIYDTGRSTLAGCLNDCLRYLQANTNAQIAVMPSPATIAEPNSTNKYYEWALMIEQICKINRVHFISSNNNMGYGKLSSSIGSLYVVDNIHNTELGGYVFAENIWYQLRNIPIFHTEIQ